MNTRIEIETYCTDATFWTTPSTLVGSGHDARSSQNGLLTIMYGSLEHASRFDWLNAGRTLVDKTYINILWQAADLPTTGVDRTRMASDLDAFVRTELQPIWDEFEHMSHNERHRLAVTLVDRCAGTVFGSGYQEEAASWLLFYLCPQLPIFPMNDALCSAAADTHDRSDLTGYGEYHAVCRTQLTRLLPRIHTAPPKAEYGTQREAEAINHILRASDWWLRRCFIQHLLNGC